MTREADALAVALNDAGLIEAGVENTGGHVMVVSVPCRLGTVVALWDGAWFIAFHAGSSWVDPDLGEPLPLPSEAAWSTGVETDEGAVSVVVRAVDEHGGGVQPDTTTGAAL